MLTILFLLFLSQSSPTPSFTDQSLTSSHEKITKEPARAEGYNDLAIALTRKERETGDAALLAQAEAAVQRSLKLEPANFDARKARVAIRLRQHRYEDALEEAQALNKQTPDDNAMYGYISEAQLALGNYSGAENAVQFMLNLRQVNGPGHERGAMVREFIGFPDGAIDWWNSALHLASDRDTEERAFIQAQLTRVYREMGKYDAALESARLALALLPDYPPALYELARVRLDQGKPAEAAVLFKVLLKKQPGLEAEYWLAQATKAGWAEFESKARAAIHSPSNANALLIRYWADNGKADEGVKLGAETLARRRDIDTLHAYAWAQFRSGQTATALESIRKALEPGMKDADLFFDAGLIARAAKDNAAALSYFKQAFEINSSGPRAPEILKMMTQLTPSL